MLASVLGIRPARSLWVFAYGSLVWRPGFRFVARMPAHLHGWHRAFCIRSVHWRGTAEHPGLVLGLDRGGRCRGVAYRVAARDALATLHYLRARELVTGVYAERMRPVVTPQGTVAALCYVSERSHAQYAGRLGPAQVAERIRHARGVGGTGPDYLRDTRAGLLREGIRDPMLEAVWHALHAPAADASRSGSTRN